MSAPAIVPVPDIIFLDLQTSGFYQRGESLVSPAQPWAPYIGALQCNGEGQIVNHFACYIRGDGRMVKAGAMSHHAIDHTTTMRVGVREPRALGMLTEFLRVGNIEHMNIVTFGDMDVMVVASLLAKFAVSMNKQQSEHDRLWLRRPNTTFVDLQKPFAQELCKIPSELEEATEYKWPTFNEAVATILGRDGEARWGTLESLLAMKDMYFKLKADGYFPDFVPQEAGDAQ